MTEAFYRLALVYQKGMGNSLIKKMIRLFGSATAIFEDKYLKRNNLHRFNNATPFPALTSTIEKDVERELKIIEKENINLCFFDELSYPQRLHYCKDSPYLLFCKGNKEFNKGNIVSLVGTRRSTSYGKECVKKLISGFSEDITVVSGLAIGIDTASHSFAIEYGLNTVAVMGAGFGNIYPSINRKLMNKIIESGGTIVSEYSFYTKPEKVNFPKRNRIIAGMADAVVVVETGIKGGSMITANIASSYNKDVFAVPGSVFETTSDGCHELIRKNIAAIVTSGEELMDMMGWSNVPQTVIQKLFIEFTPEEEKIVKALQQKQILSLDDIFIVCSELTPSKVASLLLELELKGVLECKPGRKYQLI